MTFPKICCVLCWNQNPWHSSDSHFPELTALSALMPSEASVNDIITSVPHLPLSNSALIFVLGNKLFLCFYACLNSFFLSQRLCGKLKSLVWKINQTPPAASYETLKATSITFDTDFEMSSEIQKVVALIHLFHLDSEYGQPDAAGFGLTLWIDPENSPIHFEVLLICANT